MEKSKFLMSEWNLMDPVTLKIYFKASETKNSLENLARGKLGKKNSNEDDNFISWYKPRFFYASIPSTLLAFFARYQTYIMRELMSNAKNVAKRNLAGFFGVCDPGDA